MTAAQLVEAALALAATGLPVFPCGPNKRPALAGGQGFKDASIDNLRIVELFRHDAARLIGVPTGEASGFDVLDIDPRHGGGDWEYANRWQLPETRIHRTMGGGMHWLFRHAPGVRNSAGKVAPGVDVRGDGGYVIVPPSEGYIISNDAEIAEWPDWLLEEVMKGSTPVQPRPVIDRRREPVAGKRLEAFIQSVLDVVSSARDGEKHDTLIDCALSLGGIADLAGFDDTTAKDWLLGALPKTVKNWKNAERDAYWGLMNGRLRPIELIDRPYTRPNRPNPRPPGNGNGSGPHIDGGNPSLSDDNPTSVDPEPKPYDPAQDKNGLMPQELEPIDPSELPPREWLIGTTLLRGETTMIGSPGGVGKTAIIMAYGFAFATGREDIVGEHIFQTGKVWILTLEDDRLEMKRRIAALMLSHKVSNADLKGKVWLNAASDRPILLAEAAGENTIRVCIDVEAIKYHVKKLGIGLVIIDPLVKSHRLNEIDNGQLDALATMFNGIAKETGCAVVLAHHFRKPAAGQADTGTSGFRGGTSLPNAFRVNRILVPMTATEAAGKMVGGERQGGFGIPEEEAYRYIRFEDVKANLAPKEKAFWFELHSTPLGNTHVNPIYTKGDNVQAAHRWYPGQVLQNTLDDLTGDMVRHIFNVWREPYAIGGKKKDGQWWWSPRRNGNHPKNGGDEMVDTCRWAGRVIVTTGNVTEEQAARLLDAWKKAGVWTEEEYTNPDYAKCKRLVLNDNLADAVVRDWP